MVRQIAIDFKSAISSQALLAKFMNDRFTMMWLLPCWLGFSVAFCIRRDVVESLVERPGHNLAKQVTAVGKGDWQDVQADLSNEKIAHDITRAAIEQGWWVVMTLCLTCWHTDDDSTQS